MRQKSLLLLFVVGLLAAVVFLDSSGRDDQKVVEQLSRAQKQDQVSVEASESTASGSTGVEFLPNSFLLTGQLTATKDPVHGTWFVHDQLDSTSVELPFPPESNGLLSGHREAAIAPIASVPPSSAMGFVGASACAECHRQEHNGFVHTSHHKTSGSVDTERAQGSFSSPKNRLTTRDPSLFFTMTKREDQLFQQVSFADWHLDMPMDVFTGSAKAGKTYLYWHHDALYQSHVSYLTKFDEWIPSPGFGDTTASYARRIRLECLECHITYIDRKRGPSSYHRDSVIWGISCERCHGPGRQHINYHNDHPGESIGKHIVHPETLPRQRQLDICGQCHSGAFEIIGDAFSFRPGDELATRHKATSAAPKGGGGIHTANQLTRLAMSQCFQQSEMTCTSCHDPHQNQRGNATAFTDSCLSCHEPTHCGMSQQLGENVTHDCISCHMPIGDNDGMTLQVSGGKFTVEMIDHYIRIDQDATDQYLTK